MPNPIESQIKDRISSFVAELDALVRKSTLDALKGILANGSAPARRGRPAGSGRLQGRPAGAGRGRPRGADVEAAAAKVLSHVQANDGQGISAIAEATGVALPVAKKAAAQLLASGALKKSGQKRGTVYHVGSGRAPAGRPAKRRGRKAGKRGKKAKARPTAARTRTLIPAKSRSRTRTQIELPSEPVPVAAS